MAARFAALQQQTAENWHATKVALVSNARVPSRYTCRRTGYRAS
jgi:hypothetical protein